MSFCDKYKVDKWHPTQFSFIFYVDQIYAIFTYLLEIPKKVLIEFWQYSVVILSGKLVLTDYTSDIE